ncbi:MAG: YHYH protein [Francisellaceae bacterium]|nr:YHYH protein [Francisellaceae bacterium]MBT6206409.1 YHYH protein [Francisellaceae bacterium]MBT6538950.1 YHYH protein [Francisellaceae bacterium]
MRASIQRGIDNQYRYITANGLPNHEHGVFPNRGNPNAIKSQTYSYTMPYHPNKNSSLTPLGIYTFGIAINSVIFDPVTAGFWNNDTNSDWRYEAFPKGLGIDSNNAHVQPNGSYHYDGAPIGLINSITNKVNPKLVGYAADGFPIYAYSNFSLKPSYILKKGQRPNDSPTGKYDGTFIEDHIYQKGLGDLDECNGINKPTGEYPKGIYQYVVTDEFPYVSRCFMGTPNKSFIKKHLLHGEISRPNSKYQGRQNIKSKQHNKKNGKKHNSLHKTH